MAERNKASIDRSPRLLLVACNENFRKTLRRILSRCGYAVDCATSGEEALTAVERISYDALISEVHLPGSVCGITLMRQMRAAGRELPIIFLTEEETTRIRAALGTTSRVECLRIPLDVERLKELVARCCDR